MTVAAPTGGGHDGVVATPSEPGTERLLRLRQPLPVLSRPDGALQLGLEPPAGLVLADPPSTAPEVLSALRRGSSTERLRQLAGPGAQSWLRRLLRQLDAAGLLAAPASDPAEVSVVGSGRLTLMLVRVLLGAVPGPIRVVWPGPPPRALHRLSSGHPGRLSHAAQLAGAGRAPALTVVATEAAEPDRSVLHQLGGAPHLVVRGSDLGVAVGPLVVPGATACLRCEDLHRSARDPAWPQLLAQLCLPRPRTPQGAELHWLVATAAVQVRSWLAGAVPDTLGTALELDAEGSLRARPLRAHPGCGCTGADPVRWERLAQWGGDRRPA